MGAVGSVGTPRGASCGDSFSAQWRFARERCEGSAWSGSGLREFPCDGGEWQKGKRVQRRQKWTYRQKEDREKCREDRRIQRRGIDDEDANRRDTNGEGKESTEESEESERNAQASTDVTDQGESRLGIGSEGNHHYSEQWSSCSWPWQCTRSLTPPPDDASAALLSKPNAASTTGARSKKLASADPPP